MRSPKLSPMGWAAIYAFAMPLAVGFLATPKAIEILNHPEWVQAIGSILAILASAAIAMWIDGAAERRLRRERADRDWRHATMAMVLCCQAVECFNRCALFLSGDLEEAPDPLNIETVILALNRVQFSELPDADFVVDFAIIQRNVMLGRVTYEILLEGKRSTEAFNASHLAEFNRAHGVVKTRAKNFEARVDQLQARLNAAFRTSG